MPTVVQFRRGTTEQNNNFTGAAGEISIDTTIETIRVHDGATQGGFPLVNTTSSQTLANKTYEGVSVSVTGNVSGGNLTTTGVITASGNITGSYILGNGSQLTGIDATSIQSGTSNVRVESSGGNVRFSIGGNAILAVTPAGIWNDQANGVGNIGSSTNYFNTVFAKATSAQYADVAERYLADANYPIGTVLVFGGSHEVTQSQIDHTTAIAGTVSDKPAYVMNTGLEGEYVTTVALLGRVPVRVIGTIKPGDLLVASELPGIATSLVKDRYAPGCVIGKALESYDSQREGVIEVVVGRL